MTDALLTARADAEDGIARADKALSEALRADSPLTPYLPRYVAQRAAWALVAAVLSSAIEREEARHALL